MSDQELEARRELLEKELGEVLCELWEHLLRIWPEAVVVETMMLLGLGVLSGAYTPHQVIERLGLDKNKVYKSLGAETAAQWRRVIQELGDEALVHAVGNALGKSAATRSRICLTVLLDDSLFRRYARQMASIFKWWGGAFKAVRKGHDVLGLMIEVEGQVFILDWVVVSKCGRKRKPRWKYAIEMLSESQRRMKDAGIDPALFGLAMDWWYGQVKELGTAAAEMGLTVVSEPAINEQFSVGGQKQTVEELKAAFRVQSHWGGFPTQRLRATSNTFGEVILVLFKEGDTLTLLMAKVEKEHQAQRELRALPVIRIHKQRHWIEQNWRWQKSQLRTGKIQVRKGHKPKAGYTCRMVTYAILGELQRRLRRVRAIGRQSIGTLLSWYQRLGSAFRVLAQSLQGQFAHLIPDLMAAIPRNRSIFRTSPQENPWESYVKEQN